MTPLPEGNLDVAERQRELDQINKDIRSSPHDLYEPLESHLIKDEEARGLQDLVDKTYDHWEPGKFDDKEPRVKMGTNPDLPVQTPMKDVPENVSKVLKYWNLIEKTLSMKQLLQAAELLEKYNQVFAQDEYDLGRFNRWCHKVDTGDHLPIKAKPRQLSQDKRTALEEILEEMQKTGLIRPSRSDWASAILLVLKKNGAYRLVIDFRELNKVARCCQFPLPRINDMLNALRGAKYFSAMDLAKGFHQIPLEESSKHKLAFVTPNGQYEWNVTPMGLHSSPAAFQSAMQEALAGLEYCTLVYVDDIILFTKDWDSHLKMLEEVFHRLEDFGLKASRPKCEFCRTQLRYLGHVVSSSGIQTDPRKVAAVEDMTIPTCIAEVETFLGKTGYYQRFIPDYADIAAPLMRMKRKEANFQMGPDEIAAVALLKKALVSAPILRYPDYERPFYISTDASGYGLGAILFQKYGENGEDECPIAYASRSLKDAELRYSATEREALAVWWACNHFEEYIDMLPVVVYTDHKALLALPKKEMSNRRLQIIAHKLAEFRYTIEYRPGKANANADALSRYPFVQCKGKRSKEIQTNESVRNGYNPEGNLSKNNVLPKFVTVTKQLQKKEAEQRDAAESGTKAGINAVMLSMPAPQRAIVEGRFRDLARYQREEPLLKALRQYAEEGTLPDTPRIPITLLRLLDSFYVDDVTGVLSRLRETSRSVICAPKELHEAILYDAHMAPVSGHLGVAKTLARVQEHFWWHGMARSVARFVAACPLCLAHKQVARPTREFLGDRPPPTTPWSRLHMDIWTPGGTSVEGNQHVLGLVDSFTKYLVLIPIPNRQAVTISDAVIHHVMFPYGMPEELISDGAAEFKAVIQAELYAIFGVTRRVTTPYRPQSNGQIERMFRTVRPALAMICNRVPRRWDEYLSYAAFSYNTSYHAAINSTPYYLMFGRKPNPLPAHYGIAEEEDNKTRLRKWKIALDAVLDGLCADQSAAKERYDLFQARPQAQYYRGDCVLALVTKVPKDTVHKLYPKYVGPYQVVENQGRTLIVTPLHAPNATLAAKRGRIHMDRVRPCVADYPNIHTWEQLQVPFQDPANLDPRLEPEAEDG